MLITTKLVKELGACSDAVIQFGWRFPSGRAGVKRVLAWLKKIEVLLDSLDDGTES
jgi:hypothetical protein